jgi:hypothetical protein
MYLLILPLEFLFVKGYSKTSRLPKTNVQTDEQDVQFNTKYLSRACKTLTVFVSEHLGHL